MSLFLGNRCTRGAGPAERRLAFARALVVPALFVLAAVQCAPDSVGGPSAVASVSVSPDSAMLRAVGDTVRFRATARNAAGDTVPGVTFAWLSADTSVARVVAAGLVTAVRAGRAAITATAPGGVVGAAVVKVIIVSRVVVAPDSATLRAVGDTVRFSAIAQTAGGDTVSGVTFAWASSDTSVARVSATGLVTAMRVGAATIAATAPSGAADSASVVVLPALPGSVAVSPLGVSLSGVGNSAQLAAEYRDAQGQVVAGKTFTWASGNPAVATVSGAGLVMGVAPGQATIAATADGASGYALVTVATGDTSAVQIFAPMASGTTALLYAVWGTSATNVYAVGSGGAILHFDGSSWASMASGTSSNLYAVWGSSATDVFAVGFGGTILHYDGSHWAPMAGGSSGPLNGVWGASPVDVYAVGYQTGTGAALLHWDGTAWSSRGVPTSQELRAIWGTSSGDFYMAGGGGFSNDATLLHSDGTHWSTVATGWPAFFGVWGASSAAVFAVGAVPQIHGSSTPLAMRWDGAQWHTDSIPSSPHGIWGTSARNVYAVGSGGSILRWNGAGWGGGAALVGAQDLMSVWGASAADVFAVGVGGTILRSVPGGTIAVTPVGPTVLVQDSIRLTATVRDLAGAAVEGVAVTWISSDSSVAVPNAAGMVTGRRPGTAQITATAQGGVSASATVTVPSAVAVMPDGASLAGVGSSTTLHAACGASSGSCAGTVTWASLSPAVATVDAAGVVTAVAAGQATIRATANAATAYALVTVSVPEAAPVTHWTAMASGTTVDLNAVWGASATDVSAVGGNAIQHYDGSSWSRGPGFGDIVLNSIWGASATDLYAVGTGIDIWTYIHTYYTCLNRSNGSVWTSGVCTQMAPYVGTGTTEQVWGASPQDVFFGNGGGTVLRFDGVGWASTRGSPAQDPGLWGTSATNVYAVNGGGTILRYDGSSWAVMTGNAGSGSRWAVWGTSPTDVFAVGWNGKIGHYDGSNWTPMLSGTTQTLNAIWGASATNVYAVGTGGTILHYDGSTWSPMTSGTTADLYGIWGTTPITVFVVGTKGTILQGTP